MRRAAVHCLRVLRPFLLLLVAGCGAATTTGGLGLAQNPAFAGVEPVVLGSGRFAGLFAPDAPRDQTGRAMHLYALDLDPSVRVRIRMISTAVDPMLELEGPGNIHLQNDDIVPGDLSAMLDFVPPVAGRYFFRATTVAPGTLGPYQLEVSGRPPEQGLGQPMVAGQPMQTLLNPQPNSDMPGSWSHFRLNAGSFARLWIQSTSFDTVATVIGPGGQTWTNDDGNATAPDGTGRSLDSALVVAAPTSGIYQLIVTSYGNQGAGPYRVLSAVRDPVVWNGGMLDQYAGPATNGRVYGLFAGITAYQSQSPLYGCADDARLLADAFVASRLQTPQQQVVLLDQNASRGAFLGSIQQLAQTIRPDDVLVVFFSGHGNRQAAAGGNVPEIDGTDETIVFIDGPVLDHELSAALDAVRGTTVLALDSCHSGGFADDFMTRPNRMGIFSSDEDVLSSTAEPRRAGGYLSYYFRLGIMGHADARPRDGVLFAGELTDYLYHGFVVDDALINPPNDMDALQRLVIRRGSLSHGSVLWLYPRNPDLSLPAVPNIALESAPPR